MWVYITAPIGAFVVILGEIVTWIDFDEQICSRSSTDRATGFYPVGYVFESHWEYTDEMQFSPAEHLLWEQGVVGSNPTISTLIRRMNEL